MSELEAFAFVEKGLKRAAGRRRQFGQHDIYDTLPVSDVS